MIFVRWRCRDPNPKAKEEKMQLSSKRGTSIFNEMLRPPMEPLALGPPLGLGPLVQPCAYERGTMYTYYPIGRGGPTTQAWAFK